MSLTQREVSVSAPRWVTMREVVLALGCICAASSALSVTQFAFGWYPFPTWQDAHDQFPGLLYNPTHSGQTLAIAIVALLVHRAYWLIPALAPGLYLSHSRGAWLALAFGLFASRFRYPMVLLIFVLTIGVLYTWKVSPSDSQRLQIWAAAWSYLTFWGNGFGSFDALYMGPLDHLIHPQYAHNDYLQTVFELGVWAVIPFGLVAFAASRITARDWPILVTFLFVACFSMPLHMPIMVAFFTLALVGAYNA